MSPAYREFVKLYGDYTDEILYTAWCIKQKRERIARLRRQLAKEERDLIRLESVQTTTRAAARR